MKKKKEKKRGKEYTLKRGIETKRKRSTSLSNECIIP